jgi:hypothetical protein
MLLARGAALMAHPTGEVSRGGDAAYTRENFFCASKITDNIDEYRVAYRFFYGTRGGIFRRVLRLNKLFCSIRRFFGASTARSS